MRKARPIALFTLLGLLMSGDAGFMRGQQPAPAVDVKIVKYDGLCDLISANKGKVILIDFWATWCLPCKKSFFHTVDMDKAYRDKGLVVISVSTYELSRGEPDQIKAAVLKYLKSQNANFTNVILDAPDAVVQEKLRMPTIPCLYVFNREGQWTQFIGEGLKADEKNSHPQVEQYVKYLLDRPAKKT